MRVGKGEREREREREFAYSYESEEDAGFLDGAAVAQETDDEDEGPGGDEQVGRLPHNQRLQQILHLKIQFTSRYKFNFGLAALLRHRVAPSKHRSFRILAQLSSNNAGV